MANEKSNGNRTNPKSNKISDAQHGQTDKDKADKKQPPGATR